MSGFQHTRDQEHRYPLQVGERRRRAGLRVSHPVNDTLTISASLVCTLLSPLGGDRNQFMNAILLSRWDRLLVFGGLNLAALALFVVCFAIMPALALRPRKFAIL
ncbi:hypothetical protein B0A49_12466, partial [Cryomyces minteri]